MEKTTTYVGIEDHKDSLHLAVLRPDGKKAELLEIPHEPQAIRRLAGRLLKAAPGPVECCYEAGCNGFLLQRRLRSAGLGCQVVAPSLTPRRPGERIKTDRRDAVKLAEYLKAGLLAEVQPPSEAEEAARDLCRRREQVRRDLTQERQRLSRWLQRRGLRYGKKSRWTKHHRQWLWSLRPEQVADRYSLQDQLLSLDQLEFRRQELDRAIEALSQSDPYRCAPSRTSPRKRIRSARSSSCSIPSSHRSPGNSFRSVHVSISPCRSISFKAFSTSRDDRTSPHRASTG